MLGKIEGKSRRQQQRIRWLDSVADSTDMNLSKSPEIGNGTPLQYSCLRNPMGRGAWQATIHGAAKSPIRLGTYIPHMYLPYLLALNMCLCIQGSAKTQNQENFIYIYNSKYMWQYLSRYCNKRLN